MEYQTSKTTADQDQELLDFDKARELANSYSDKILEELGFETDVYGDVKCSCPIHGGDNYRAFSWDDKRKTWLCFTGKCHEKYTKTILGLIKGVKGCNWKQVIEFIEEVTGEKIGTITREQVDLHNFLRKNKQRPAEELIVYDSEILKRIKPASQYFESRGVSQESIDKWLMFDCLTPGKTLYNRACLPIINHDDQLLGFAGRSINNMEPKWLTSPLRNKFKTTFFGINHAKETIKTTKSVILVEGFLDAVQMQDMGFTNCVSMFGIDMSSEQQNLLISLGVEEVTFMLDPDLSGVKASRHLTEKFGIFFNTRNVTDKLMKDPADLSISEIKAILSR